MSTTDVPGAVPAHGDRLREGCWAEHPDGSLLHVLQGEGGRVVYDMFDLSQSGRVIRYVDTMPIESFNRAYSWHRSDPASVRWTWHDKSGFPWDRVFDHVPQELGHDTDHVETVADEPPAALRSVVAQLAERLRLAGEEMTPEQLAALSGRRLGTVLQRLNAALDELRP